MNPSLKNSYYKGREGYCFEHNLLAKHVLNELGFESFNILCRVYYKSLPTQAPAKTHLITIVKLNHQLYLFDPGFGGVTPTGALSFGLNDEPQNTPIDSYRIISANESGIEATALVDESLILQVYEAGQWENMYGFNLDHEAVDADIKVSNWYVSTHPESKFTQNLVLTTVDQKTRYNFSNGRLSIRDENGRSEQLLNTPKDIQQMMETIFKLDTKNFDFDQLMVKLETKSP